MVYGIGTDLIEVERMEALVAKGIEYLQTIFTKDEISYCENKGRKAEHYAVRFAAKEAFLKALGTGYRNGISFSEIEIWNDEVGKPGVNLFGKAKEKMEQQHIKHISISLSHLKEIAIAMVILES